MAVYIISPRKKESRASINGNEGRIEVAMWQLDREMYEECGQRNPRPPAKYQRLSGKIERLCMKIRMYRLPPNNHSHPGTRFSNLIFKRFVARDRNKRERQGFLFILLRICNFFDIIVQSII